MTSSGDCCPSCEGRYAYRTASSANLRPSPGGSLHVLVVLTLCLASLTLVSAQQSWNAWQWNPWVNKPWDNFYPSVVVETLYGKVQGFSVPWHVDDQYWTGDGEAGGEYPQWYLRRINCFLGVPYAQPPVGFLRFRRPMPPRWLLTWDATYYRNACPQRLDEISKDIPTFPRANVSEDCLYMNIFVPNKTSIENSRPMPDRFKYPVIVWLHGGDFIQGTSQQWPGHVMATRDVVVVTINYRLGALGYLSTEDEHAPGNWGILDQVQALRFIKENIGRFRGDPNKITLMGEGAGAVSVGLHLLSPLSRRKGYYHQTAMMSGTDLSPFGFINPYWRPREYAHQLAEDLNCPTEHNYNMMECLRDNSTITWHMILDAQERVIAKNYPIGTAWGPVQDGVVLFPQPTSYFLPETPSDLRLQGRFDKVPTLIGLDTHAGAAIANASIRGLDTGMLPETFEKFVKELLVEWRILDHYRDRVYEAVDFQYTYWPDPHNLTSKAQMFINMLTDLEIGKGMDLVAKQQYEEAPTYMYQFNYKSWNDWVPRFMGVSCSAAVPYVFGFPFMNETVLNETELVPRQYYDYDDRNISDWMMYMWTNFAKYGEPTPNITRNVTWDTFNMQNLSYLVIDWYPHTWYRYRQDFYGFWNYYFPRYAKQDYLYPTATPTPAGYAYVYSTGAMSTVFILLLCGIGLMAYLMWYQKERDDIDAAYRDQDMQMHSYGLGQSVSSASLSSMSRRTPGGATTPIGLAMDPLPLPQKSHHAYAQHTVV